MCAQQSKYTRLLISRRESGTLQSKEEFENCNKGNPGLHIRKKMDYDYFDAMQNNRTKEVQESVETNNSDNNATTKTYCKRNSF